MQYDVQPVKVPASERAALIEDARKRGVIALECEECGYRHPLTRLNFGCNAAHSSIDGETCDGWNLRGVTA